MGALFIRSFVGINIEFSTTLWWDLSELETKMSSSFHQARTGGGTTRGGGGQRKWDGGDKDDDGGNSGDCLIDGIEMKWS